MFYSQKNKNKHPGHRLIAVPVFRNVQSNAEKRLTDTQFFQESRVTRILPASITVVMFLNVYATKGFHVYYDV